MTAWEGDYFQKPERWEFDRSSIDPEWDWFWDSALKVVPFWESSGAPLELVSGTYLTPVSAPIRSVNRMGMVGEAIGIGDHWHFGSGAFVPLDSVTIALITEKTDATNRDSAAFGLIGAGAANERFDITLPWSDGNYYFDFGGTAGINRLVVTAPPTAGIRRVVCRAGTRGLSVWQNASFLKNSPTAVTRSASSNNMGINRGNTGASSQGDLSKCTYHPR